jgi:hypothetical protein
MQSAIGMNDVFKKRSRVELRWLYTWRPKEMGSHEGKVDVHKNVQFFERCLRRRPLAAQP